MSVLDDGGIRFIFSDTPTCKDPTVENIPELACS